MAKGVCEGYIGQIQKDEASTDRVEGLVMKCPDGSKIRAIGEPSDSLPAARRTLRKKGFNADLEDRR